MENLWKYSNYWIVHLIFVKKFRSATALAVALLHLQKIK